MQKKFSKFVNPDQSVASQGYDYLPNIGVPTNAVTPVPVAPLNADLGKL